MEHTILNSEKDGQKKEDPFQSLSNDIEVVDDNSLSRRLVKRVKPQCMLILNVKESPTRESCIQESFLQSVPGLDNRIPKHIISFNERYLRRCLELIYIFAYKATSLNISSNLGSLKAGVLSNSSYTPKISNRYACDLTKFIVECPLAECPLAAGTGNAVISPAGDCFVGRITGSKSMMNILKSPLFHQFGALDRDVNYGRINFIDVKGEICADFNSSPGGLGFRSSRKLEKERVVLGNHRYGSEPVHKRLVSGSSTNSTLSDQSSSSVSAAITQGMLQCTWRAGFPRYVFSIDDQREIYVANSLKAESPDDRVLDYMYVFHSGVCDKKEHDIHENESDLVGKMRVSTSFTLCPNNSEIMETEFVLFGLNDNCAGETQTSSHIFKKKRGLSRKMVEVFKTSHSSKHRTSSKFGGTNAILENSSFELSQDLCNNLNPFGRDNLSENHLLPNLELAAIIVKTHISDNRQEAGIGGWGLKFLKKVGTGQANVSLEASAPSECCPRNFGDCSTSMDILVPAGFHGGPRTRNGGPSSLTERWRSGGHCDCGGWDIGCPLTVLDYRPNKKETLPPADTQGECKSFDLFIQGSEKDAPIVKMVNIHDGLYSVNFQSNLSALQSFSIAVAIIHTRSPNLRPKFYRS